MPDICMCRGTGCSVKKHCYRHKAKPTPGWQTYFATPPGNDASCAHYWPTGTKAPKPVDKRQDEA